MAQEAGRKEMGLAGFWEKRKKRRRSRWRRILGRVIAFIWNPPVLITIIGLIIVLLISYYIAHL
mgnify:CR=1 FL=1